MLRSHGLCRAECDGQPDFGVFAAVGAAYAGQDNSAGVRRGEGDGFGAVFAESAPVAACAPVGVPQRVPLACSLRRYS